MSASHLPSNGPAVGSELNQAGAGAESAAENARLRERVRELEALCARADTVIGWLMPGIGAIAIPDYGELNNVCCDLAMVKPQENTEVLSAEPQEASDGE